MEAAESLAKLQEDSTQVEAAVVFDRTGKLVGATIPDARAKRLAKSALELLRVAEQRAPAGEGGAFQQLEVALPGGSVFLVRDEERLIAATTRPEPTVGLVFYDLKSCLRRLGEDTKPRAKAKPGPASKPPKPKPKPKPSPAAKKRPAAPKRKKRAES